LVGRGGWARFSRRCGHGLIAREHALGRSRNDRFGLLDAAACELAVQAQRRGQTLEKGAFGGLERAVGLADAERELEGELTQGRRVELRRDRFEFDTAEQHRLVQGDEIDLGLAAERLGDLAHVLALFGVLMAIGERRHQADGDEGSGLLWVHAEASCSWGCPGATGDAAMITSRTPLHDGSGAQNYAPGGERDMNAGSRKGSASPQRSPPANPQSSAGRTRDAARAACVRAGKRARSGDMQPFPG